MDIKAIISIDPEVHGGYFYYRGLIEKTDSLIDLKLDFLDCDFCNVPTMASGISYPQYKVKIWKGIIRSDGIFIEGNKYMPSFERMYLQSELPKH